MELGTQVPQRSFSKRHIFLSSVCLIIGLGAVLLLTDTLDGVHFSTVSSAPSVTVEVPNGPTNKTAHGMRCSDYAVCKCVTMGNGHLACQANTCKYNPNAGSVCEAVWDPNCGYKTPGSNWGQCEWANFPDPVTKSSAGGEYPGEGYYTSVPRTHYSVYALSFRSGVAVFSDLDDTVTCSGGGMAGVDTECKGTAKHDTYPGVAQFMLALSRGPNDIQTPAKVLPLSARPRELRAFLAMKENTPVGLEFKRAGWSHGLDWGLDVDNAQYGSIYDAEDVSDAMWGEQDLTPYNRLGYRKFKNWQAIHTMLGKATTFVGDNGQGDLVAAQMILKYSHKNAEPDSMGAMRVAFIHDAKQECTRADCYNTWMEYGILMFNDYAQAAVMAYRRRLISRAACHEICQICRIKFYTPCSNYC